MYNYFFENFDSLSKNIQQNCSITLDKSIMGFKVTLSSTSGTARLSNLGFNGASGSFVVIADVSGSASMRTQMDLTDKGNVGFNITTTPTRCQIVVDVTNYNTSGNYNGFFDNVITGASGDVITFKNVKIFKASNASGNNSITKQGIVLADNFTENEIGCSISKYDGIYATEFIEY